MLQHFVDTGMHWLCYAMTMRPLVPLHQKAFLSMTDVCVADVCVADVSAIVSHIPPIENRLLT